MTTYCQAINQAIMQEMDRDSSIFVYGIGVPDHKKVFGSMNGILEKFGPKRCFDTPLSESAMTGFGIGAAINGMRPIQVHIRIDFMLLAMNQIINMMSSFNYMSHGLLNIPIVIRAIVGRGWGQGCQHSKSMHSVFAHIPGLKVVLPTTPADAKGLLVSAIRDNNPVIFMEHRWLYWQEGEIPDGEFSIPLGTSNILRKGSDVTIVATSWMNVEALKAAEVLAKRNISVEIVDPRTIAPLDDSLIIQSVQKTGLCIVADNDWIEYGFSGELVARITSACHLRSPIRRIGFAKIPCPTARHMENQFYPNAIDIIRNVEDLLGIDATDLSNEEFYSHERKFKGPF